MTTSPLDPESWDEFSLAAHRLLDACIERLKSAEKHPWRPVPEDVKESFKKIETGKSNPEDVSRALIESVLPYGVGNTHPGFYGWVHGTGLASGILSEMVSASINANCGGRDHGSIYIERAVIDWTRKIMGFPQNGSGVLVCGTSQATVIALAVARVKKLGVTFRRDGAQGDTLRVYAGQGVHNAIPKAMELLGIGGENLCRIPEDGNGMDVTALEKALQQDLMNGYIPIAVVATAGSVDLGRFDDFNAIAEVCRRKNVWFHVDGAFGAWTRLAEVPWRKLGDGIERADSLACDFHKWMHVPYDCGIVLISREDDHRAAFSSRPAYLQGQICGVGGGEPWFCDYGIDLSRGNRGLKVWTALKLHGTKSFARSISENCKLAQYMAQCVEDDAHMALAAPVVSNVCVFTADARQSPKSQTCLNTKLTHILQLNGTAVFSTTTIGGITYIRAAITNHRADKQTVRTAIRMIANLRDKTFPSKINEHVQL